MKSSRASALPAAVFFGIARLLAPFDWMERVESLRLDARARLRQDIRPAPRPEEAVIIGIDSQSLWDFERWPWPRGVHGIL